MVGRLQICLLCTHDSQTGTGSSPSPLHAGSQAATSQQQQRLSFLYFTGLQAKKRCSSSTLEYILETFDSSFNPIPREVSSWPPRPICHLTRDSPTDFGDEVHAGRFAGFSRSIQVRSAAQSPKAAWESQFIVNLKQHTRKDPHVRCFCHMHAFIWDHSVAPAPCWTW
jgi:hypothetical protein